MNPLTKMSIRKQLFILLIILVTPIFLMNWYANEKAKDILTNQVTGAFVELIKQNHTLIDQDIDTINQITKTIILHPLLQQMADDSTQTLDLVKNYEQLNKVMKDHTLLGREPVLYSLFMTDDRQRYFFAPGYQSLRSGVFFISGRDKPSWYDEALDKKGKGFLKVIDNFGSSKGKTLAYIRTVNDVTIGDNAIGVLVVTHMEDLIKETLNQVSLPEGEIVFMDEDNTVYAGTDRQLGTSFSLPAMDETSHEPVHLIQSDYVYVQDRNREEGYKLVYRIPVNSLVKQQTELTRAIQTVSIVYIVFCFAVMFYFIQSFSQPLYKLAKLFKSYEPGDILPLEPDVKRKDEIGVLTSSVYSMTHRLKKLISDKYEMEIKHKESQLQILYEQINPHLLYNILESIYWKSSLNGETESAQMIKELSKLMKIGLSRGRDLIRMEEELEHVKAYIGLQQKRYDAHYQVIWHIDADVLPAVIPKITLQPLVENAILHGVRNMDEDGKITVSAFVDEDKVVVLIEDNGFKKIDLAAIRRLLDEEDGDPSVGYGIRNVHRRIQMHFGHDYGLKYDHGEFQGTRVTVELPYTIEKKLIDKEGS